MSSSRAPKPRVGPFRHDPTFELPTGVERALFDAAAAALPHEACGLVVVDDRGAARAVVCENVATTPRTSFRYAPQDQLRAAREHRAGRLVALWHSHVDGPAELSPDDLRGLTLDGAPLYVGTHVLIVVSGPAAPSEVVAYSADTSM